MSKLLNKLTSITNAIIFSGLFIRGKIFPGFTINKNDLVIDIGCGDKPFWRADVFLDKLSLGNEHRFSSTGVVKDLGLFIDSDVAHTPFRDKIFDYSYCSHLLEHVEKPNLAIKEIVRISKRGYIEVPDGLIELIFPYQSHLWFVFATNNKLIFLRKSKTVHETLAKNKTKYSYLVKFMKHPFIRFYWKDNIKYEIVDNLPNKEKFFSIVDNRYTQPYYIQTTYLTIVKTLRKLFYRNKSATVKTLEKKILKKA